MQGQIPTYSPSDCRHDGRFTPQDNGIGELFREYGEAYIRIYRPSPIAIKLIRSIRLCKTPALGGKAYQCKHCGTVKYVYFSCGNSRCPKCQGIKRLQWQDRLSNMLFKCPYLHMVFTMPSELKGLSTDNPSQLYNCLMRSAWASLKQGCLDKENLGALPGAIMVLHTFGSDLKYHVHVHALVSFGGVDEQGQWQWPNRKRKIVPFRQIRNDYRDDFLKRLKSIYPNLTTRQSYDKIYDVLSKKSWCVHCEPPTTNTKVIEEYLGRYICRIGLSKNRFHYDSVNREVSLSFKDYRNKDKSTGEVPKGIKKMNPLVAINQIMKHCLPAYFQKCRYYGLHASSCQRKYQNIIPKKIRNNNHTVRTIFQIIHAMLGIEEITCENCGHPKFDQWIILPDKQWMHSWLKVPIMNKGSPQKRSYNKNAASVLKRKGLLFAIHQVNHK